MNLYSAGCKLLTALAILLTGLLSNPVCQADIVVGEVSSESESNVAICLDTLKFDSATCQVEDQYPHLGSGIMNAQFLGNAKQPFEKYDRGTTVPEPDNFVLIASLILAGLFFLANHRTINRTQIPG